MNRNSVHIIGDLTGDIYYDNFTVDSKATPFLRLMVVIQGSSRKDPTPPLRVVFYGRRAQIVEAFAQKGARFYIQGHLQLRSVKDRTVVEVVCEHAEALRYANFDRGYSRIEELKQIDPELTKDLGSFIDGLRNPEEESKYSTVTLPGFRPHDKPEEGIDADLAEPIKTKTPEPEIV
ncbi:MAG: single-stranded DNA-binding protein [Anaerolineales bacterium]|jgi:single-stranded DNA-binding protein|nr:single-stranded DNA-binding protein [Anaerolineales bacterium]